MTTIYAAYCKNEAIRKDSSSGGIFSILAEEVIRQGGVVWGAAYDTDFNVCHIEVSDSKDISLLRGSKYVQSRLSKEVISTIIYQLKEGKTVLFSGTPCQIEIIIKQLDSSLRKKMIAVDFTCHGTPLPEVWDAYLKDFKKKSGSICKVNMRNKKYGWKTYSMYIEFTNGDSFSEIFTFNHYSQAFLRNYSLRKACYTCAFRGVHPNSDITLADYWDISKKHFRMNDDKGISKLYVHTETGKSLINKIQSSIVLLKDQEINNFRTPQKKIIEPQNRKLFFDLLRTKGFKTAYMKTVYKGFLRELLIYMKGFSKIMLYYIRKYLHI